jgi:tetratricopeptide (TPR) repeat protein
MGSSRRSKAKRSPAKVAADAPPPPRPVESGALPTAIPRPLADAPIAEPASHPQGQPLGRLGVAGAIVVMIACALNGRSAAALSLLACFTGLGLLLFPPRHKLPPYLWLPACAGLLLGAVSFLPAHWFGALPNWRHTLINTWELALPSSATAQPDITLGAWLTFAIGCGWFFLFFGHANSESSRRLILRTIALSMLSLSALALAAKFQWLPIQWPIGSTAGKDDLGPFPNRNHFAGFCAIGAILSAALSLDAYRKRSALWILFAVGGLLFASCIFLNTSRAGIGLLFIGITAWLATASVNKDFLKRIAVAISVILAGVAILAFQKEGVGARLFDPQTGLLAEVAAYQGRTSIQLQAASLLLQRPFAGVGLGQFDPTFAMSHHLPEHYVRFTHPESDWLWWASEAGIGLLLAIGVAVGWLVRVHRPKARRRTHSKADSLHLRLRLAALIGLALALLHGFVDVPLHNAGIVFLILLLASLTIAPDRLALIHHPVQSNIQRLGFRLAGLAILGLGVLLTLTALGHPLYPGRMRLDAERALIQPLVKDGHYQDALVRITRQIERSPLQWDLHYQSATLRLALRQPNADALADFNRARALEPNNLDVCYQEGLVWLRYEPSLAILPWRELFLRSNARSHFYQQMFAQAQPFPEVLQDLRRLAQTPPMILTAIAYTPAGDEWQALLNRLLDTDPSLQQLKDTERQQLFQLWQQRGDRGLLVKTLEGQLDWQSDAWQILAEEYAQAALFDKAWAIQKRFGFSETHLANTSALKQNLSQLERQHLLHPTDIRRGVDLFYALKAAKRQPEALRLLEKLIALPDSPLYLRQELAVIHANNRDFRRAYETLKEALARRS